MDTTDYMKAMAADLLLQIATLRAEIDRLRAQIAVLQDAAAKRRSR